VNESEAVQKAFRENPRGMERLRQLLALGIIRPFAEVDSSGPVVIVGGPWPSRIRGSKQVRCGKCNRFLGISPSTQAMIAARTGVSNICCFNCVARDTPTEKICWPSADSDIVRSVAVLVESSVTFRGRFGALGHIKASGKLSRTGYLQG
jgi:hypothetical protein